MTSIQIIYDMSHLEMSSSTTCSSSVGSLFAFSVGSPGPIPIFFFISMSVMALEAVSYISHESPPMSSYQ
jgi:hypothetical protein